MRDPSRCCRLRLTPAPEPIWERSTEQNGMVSKQYSVRINKRYRDNKTSEFKTTEYYFPADLPKLMLAAQKAFEFVSLKGEE